MKKRNLPQNTKNERVKRQRDPLPWRYCILTVVCGLILVGGFFYAARQHFSAIDYGIKNSKLREQKEDLKDDQRRLYVAKETAMSSPEIKKAAKKIGFQEFASSSIEAVTRKIDSINPLASKKAVDKAKQELTGKNSDAKSDTKKEEKPKSEKVAKAEKENKSKEPSTSGDVRPRVAKK